MKTGKRFALMDVSVIDGNGGKPVNNQAVIINDGYIEKVCPADEINDDSLEKISLPGKYVMPGLIDSHVHILGITDLKYWGQIEYSAALTYSYSQALRLLKYGFTSVRDISENGVYLKRAFNMPGVTGPRIVACGRGLNRTGGHADVTLYNELDFEEKNNMVAYRADGADECRKAVRRILRTGADQIKFWATGGGNNFIDRYTDIHYSEEEIRAICEEAKLIEGTKVLAHCENPELSKICIEAGVDSIEHCTGYAPFLCDLMKEKDVYLVPTMRLLTKWVEDVVTGDFEAFLNETIPKFFQRDFLIPSAVSKEEQDQAEVDEVKAAFRHAVENGIKIGLGSDTCFEKLMPYGWYGVLEMESMQECGMTAEQVICSATKINSEILGLEKALGTVEEGKLADLLIVNQDPTEDVRVFQNDDIIEYIFLGGKLVVDHGRMVL